MRVYLAAPFFNPKQLAIVRAIEGLLVSLDADCYSPRRDGVLQDMAPDERRAATRRIFQKNVDEIDAADMIVAVIDDRDVGVMWELGYAHAKRQAYIVTYTEADYGLNVMIQECVDAHVRGLAELRDCLTTLEFNRFRDFDPRVT